ncbi:MAG: hypothetical protein JNM41_06340 [Flavipsychrobacter sp.]|nr:hypothetical protein [Flavipsychrobacter sp.]
MTNEEQLYNAAASKVNGAVAGQMFGKPCYKIGGKAFVCFFQQEAAFKLTGADHANALALTGAKLFDPSGKGRPMKEWVQVPAVHSNSWSMLAAKAAGYVSSGI